ncbi:MAG: hypothetical protein HYY06_12710 [Deltaproteobacteria bacterium]|nr:hypothetical protein [Deltaproteobacteria bacterium]
MRDRLPFAGPFPFIERAWPPSVPSEPIVNRLRAWDLESDRAQTIDRAGGIDRDGILDMGESANGRRRLEDFLAAAECRLR